MSTKNAFPIAMRKISELKPAEYNPRKLSEKQFEDLKKSFQKLGTLEPAVINVHAKRKDVIISGHQRLKVAASLGMKDYPCVEVSFTLEKEKEANIRMNRNTGEWDLEMLLGEFELDDLMDWGFEDIDLGLNSDDTPKDGKTDPDAVPEVPKVAKTKPGDLYQLGDHRLLCGDATVITDAQKLMGDTLADLIVTDPPYNVAYEGKTKEALTIQNDKMGDSSFAEFLHAAYLSYFASSKAGAGIYVFHADSEGVNFRQQMMNAGFLLKQCCIWVKNTLVMGRQDFHWKHEPILYGWKEGAAHNWHTDRKQTTVWEFDRPTRSTDHPTMKPVELVSYPIKCSSKKGQVVIDFFGGSGTTLLSCETLGRACFMMELDPKYVDVIVKRWEDFTGKKAKLVKK